MHTGKRTAQLRLPQQLRDNEEVARDVRLLSEFDHRSLQDEMRHIFMLGLERRVSQVGNETMSTLRRAVSLRVAMPEVPEVAETAASPAVAPRRAVSREVAARRTA